MAHSFVSSCAWVRQPAVVARAAAPRVVASASAGPASSTFTAGCKLTGCGSSVPSTVLTNEDLSKLVDTNDEWIATRTGIRRRHVLGPGETLSDHATIAAQRAMEMAGVTAEQIDMVLLATSSPDDLFGSACQVQARLGAKNAVAYDITAACSGFVVGVVNAAQYIRTGVCKNVLVIGADALSRYVDWRDRATCILFGDGCGAVVLQAQEGQCSLLGLDMHSDGEGHKHLQAHFTGDGSKPFGDHASAQGSFKNIGMNGQEVFKFAVRAVPQVLENSIRRAGLQKEDIDWFVLHQANQRILNAAADRLGVSEEKVITNLAQYGNTSAASIPLALDDAVRQGFIKPGDTIAMAGFGAGLTWAGAVVRWG